MAQPVFDGHPLEEYFTDSGDASSELMPGGIPEPYLTGPSSTTTTTTSKHAEKMEKVCIFICGMLESFCADHASLRTKAFAERFKYGVISSSLLSPAAPPPPVAEPHKRSLPGKLPNAHSRTPSTATDISLSMPPEPETSIWPLTLSFAVAIAALGARFYFFTFLLLAATLYYMHVHRLDVCAKPDVMTPSLLALQHLVSAGHLWDAVINDTLTVLDNEERSIFYGPASPLMPSSSLRVALSTSLLTTQTQCDNVRQLLSAITSPIELAQLTEMYAPPSPIKPTFAPHDTHRPLSHPGPSPRTTPLSDRIRKRSTWNGSYASLALAGTPPTPSSFQLAQRRAKRRSDLNVLLGTTATSTSSPTPARIRGSPSSQLLADVSEEDEDEDGMVTAESSIADEEEHPSFGAVALGLYRNRLKGGLRTLELTSSSHRSTPPPLTSPTRGGERGDDTPAGLRRRARTTMSPGSKYTSMQQQAARHPFSLSSLRQSLQSALASKRFACSHLLALRFDDDDDEVYWEDVRAVMSLLTSTLADASSRLSEVLEEVEERHLKLVDEAAREDDCSIPASASASGLHTPSLKSSPATSPPPPTSTTMGRIRPLSSHADSFAPTLSPLARFASHVDAISTALDDAREQLALCVASLKSETERTMTDGSVSSPGHSSHPSSSSSAGAGAGAGNADRTTDAAMMTTTAGPSHTGNDDNNNSNNGGGGTGATAAYGEPAEHPAIQAYERLRRELGLALRECERGRERLMHLVMPPTPSTSTEEEDADEVGFPTEGSAIKRNDDDDDDVCVSVVSPSGEAVLMDHRRPGAAKEGGGGGLGLDFDCDQDDPTATMGDDDSLGGGVEQVFEAETGHVGGVFARERSKLSREERIRIVKARRERAVRQGVGNPFCVLDDDIVVDLPRKRKEEVEEEEEGERERERWGPSGDVVEELRDVIWKVGERRRKMTCSVVTTTTTTTPASETSLLS